MPGGSSGLSSGRLDSVETIGCKSGTIHSGLWVSQSSTWHFLLQYLTPHTPHLNFAVSLAHRRHTGRHTFRAKQAGISGMGVLSNLYLNVK